MTGVSTGFRRGVLWLAAAAILAAAVPGASAAADGWFVLTDPRKRAFLIWGDGPDGENRPVNFACLRDADSFSVYLGPILPAGPSGAAVLTLARGNRTFTIEGRADVSDGRRSFDGEVDIEKKPARDSLKASLAALLKAPGPLSAAIGQDRTTITAAPVEPKAWATFERICFGR